MLKARRTIQAFDDGAVSICSLEEDGSLTVKYPLLRYAERTVGIKRYYAAMQENAEIALVIRIHRRDDISTQDVAVIEGAQYRIRQVQRPADASPPCCDLSLEKVVHSYDAGRV